MTHPLDILRLGRVEYADGLRLMEAYGTARRLGTVADTLLLLEHPPVITLGRKGQVSDVLLTPGALEAAGIEVFETDRGGEVTYHGPGQLVVYPILDLAPDRRDVRKYVRNLEEVMLRGSADFGVRAGRVEGLIGIWLAPDASPPAAGPARKLGALGVHLSRWITSHGFALNVNTDLQAYQGIVPCGIQDRGVTSLSREIGRPIALEAVEDSVIGHFAALFDAEVRTPSILQSSVQVQVIRRGPAGAEVLALHRVARGGDFWQPVTGWVERGESTIAAASRELQEEVGLEVEVRPLQYVHAFLSPLPEVVAPTQEAAFVAVAPAGFVPRLSLEHDAYEWLPTNVARDRFPFAGLRRGAALAAQLLSAAT